MHLIAGKRTRAFLKALLCLLTVLLLILGQRAFLCAAYPLRYTSFVQQAASTHHVPESLIYAVIRVESDYNPNAHSDADARGLMQITEDTMVWSRFRANRQSEIEDVDLFDPGTNIRIGTHILSLLNERYGDLTTVLAAYNAGMGTVDRWLQSGDYSADGKTLTRIPYPETEHYVQKVLQSRDLYRKLYSFNNQEEKDDG